jgi:tetratricopeptide (TPR) repeat protein
VSADRVGSGDAETDTIAPATVAEPSARGKSGLTPGERVGRYVIHGELGLGGMGVVLDAHDPDLNRRVAIKMLHAGKRDRDAAQQRLLREAQALARLSHPNVVAVYDVGTTDAGIYVAMEYVSGPTLRQWGKEQHRAPAEVLKVFGEAGRGLAAAHAAGLIHRDFKPSNVILGDDGRVRVLDFGLARSAHLDDPDADPRNDPALEATPWPVTRDHSSSSRRSHDRLDTPITVHGMIIGTPRYMAPEQHQGAAIGPPADVFAFCVSLYEVLFARHPFGAGDDFVPRLIAGNVDEPPAVDGVPAHVSRIVLRGLAAAPDQRPTMAEILRELARDRWRTLRIAAIGAVLVATSAGAAVVLSRGSSPPACDSGEAQLAGAWDDAARSAVRSRFADAAQTHVAAAANRVVLMLDDYARRWAVKHHEICAATNVEHAQSTALMDQRMACLDARRAHMAALARGLADRKNGAGVDDAISATSSLLDLDSCDDVAHFEPTVALPASPVAAREVTAIRADIATLIAQIGLGDVAAALPKAKALAERADHTGFLPIRAQAADLYAYARLEAGDTDNIEPLLESLVVLGGQAKNDATVATGFIELMRLRGTARAKTSEALAMRYAAEGALHRAGDPPRLEGDYYNALADIYDTAADYPASRDAQEHVLELLKKTRGPRHVLVGGALVNLGGTQFGLGDYDRALAYFREAQSIYEEQVGPDSPRVAIALTNIAQVMVVKHQLAEALPMLERALAIKEHAFGPDHKGVAITLLAIADLHEHAHRWREALPLVRRSHAILKAQLAAEHPHLATAGTSLGQVMIRLGQYDEGCALVDQAAPSLIKTYQLAGAAQTVAYQAECETHRGHAKAAVELLAPVIAEVDAKKDPWIAGLLRFRSAQAEAAAAGHATERSTGLANEAEALFAGDGDADDAGDVRAWLSPGR